MTTEQFSDVEMYAEMVNPFKSAEHANSALTAFFDEVYELRCKHKLANVSVIVKDSISDDGSEFMCNAHFGNELEREAMAAWHLGRSYGERPRSSAKGNGERQQGRYCTGKEV